VCGVPGAMTPTCSESHLPGFISLVDEFKSKGVDTVACISVNDPFVMSAWGKKLDVGDKVTANFNRLKKYLVCAPCRYGVE
jgi:peroxiredoxin